MSSTSAAERAATSGPKTQSDSNPHVATPAPHDPTPVKPMQVAILAKKRQLIVIVLCSVVYAIILRAVWTKQLFPATFLVMPGKK